MSSCSSRSSSRYNSFDNNNHRSSSTHSDPSKSSSSSIDLTITRRQSPGNVSAALAKSKSTKNDQSLNLSGMVKKFMEKRNNPNPKPREFVLPSLIDDLNKKKNKSKSGGFVGLHSKLFGKSDGKKKTNKALALLPENARTLAAVLRSERELMSQNKDQETEIMELKVALQEKNTEVDNLKDLCLKQREEIKALKSAILFPDQQNQEVSEELKNAKEIIPTLQRQVTSLTGQLLHLAQDLAEVKADKYSVIGCYEGLVTSPRTPTHEQEEATNSLEFSSGDYTTPGSPDDMFLNDLNPCLTPYAKSKSKSKEFEEHSSSSYNNITTRCHETWFGVQDGKLSKSSNDKQQYVNSGKILGHGSDENSKYTHVYGKLQNVLHY